MGSIDSTARHSRFCFRLLLVIDPTAVYYLEQTGLPSVYVEINVTKP